MADINLLSNSQDDFLDCPKTKPKLRKIGGNITDTNICVHFNNLGKTEFQLMTIFSLLCVSQQKKTRTHYIALIVMLPEREAPSRFGFCDKLTAENLVLRLCLSVNVDFIAYRNYTLPDQYIISENNLGKRPFKF